jgi:hypothetical protein
MPLEDSPSLENYSGGTLPDGPGPASRQKVVRLVILALTVLAVVLGIANFLNSADLAVFTATGTVTGLVVDNHGSPLPADIYILGGVRIEAKANQDGSFSVSGVPAGQRSVFAGYQGVGSEVPFDLPAGGVVNVGKIEIVETSMPPQ